MPPVVAMLKLAGTPVPVPVKSKLPSPPTVVLLIESEAFLVLVNVQVGVSPASITARTVVSPRSKPAVVPSGEAGADAGADGDHRAVGGAHDVRQRPAGLGRLLDVLCPELDGR